MRKSIFKLTVILAALLVSMGSMAQSGKVNNFRIKRGTNVSHWLSQ
jgi:endoglucanase